MPKRVSVKGKGADLFFGDYDSLGAAAESAAPMSANGLRAESPLEPSPAAAESAPPELTAEVAKTPEKPSRARSVSQHASATASSVASQRDNELASMLASVEVETIEAIRKVVKTLGRDVSFVRLTPEEKAEVSDIVYTYKRQGQKTTENQINRIAINYLLHDYHEHGEQSVLARVLASLLA